MLQKFESLTTAHPEVREYVENAELYIAHLEARIDELRDLVRQYMKLGESDPYSKDLIDRKAHETMGE